MVRVPVDLLRINVVWSRRYNEVRTITTHGASGTVDNRTSLTMIV